MAPVVAPCSDTNIPVRGVIMSSGAGTKEVTSVGSGGPVPSCLKFTTVHS